MSKSQVQLDDRSFLKASPKYRLGVSTSVPGTLSLPSPLSFPLSRPWTCIHCLVSSLCTGFAVGAGRECGKLRIVLMVLLVVMVTCLICKTCQGILDIYLFMSTGSVHGPNDMVLPEVTGPEVSKANAAVLRDLWGHCQWHIHQCSVVPGIFLGSPHSRPVLSCLGSLGSPLHVLIVHVTHQLKRLCKSHEY